MIKKIIGAAAGAALAATALIAPAANAVNLDLDNLPPNAVVSEGNGAAVFIGYGGNKEVNLAWRPSKQYEKASMLYQVQRSDGAMLVSKSGATAYTDRNLRPNTAYTYTLTVYQSVDKEKTIKKGKQKGKKVKWTVTKQVGQNVITVLTLPGEPTGLYNPNMENRLIRWQPPADVDNPVTYNIYVDGNLWDHDFPGLEYRFPNDLFPNLGTKATVKVCAVNASGEGKSCSQIKVPFPVV